MDEAQDKKDPDHTQSQETPPQSEASPNAEPVNADAATSPTSGPDGDAAAAPDSPPVTQGDGPDVAEQIEAEFPPEALVDDFDPDDKPIGALAIEDDEAETSASEATPAADAEQQPATEEPAAEVDVAATIAKLDELRPQLVAAVFGQERPRKTAAQQAVEGFVTVLRDASGETPAQWTQLLSMVAESNQRELTQETASLEQAAADMKRHVVGYDTLFVELGGLSDAAAAQLQQMDAESEGFQQAPEALQTTLANYRKGIEIVHRMISRAKDRKKELSAEMPVSIGQEIEQAETPQDVDQFAVGVMSLSEAFHKLRDANYHATQDAKGEADKCLQATLAALKQVLSAVDGIDSGLASEPLVRAKVAEIEEDESCHTLAESWFGAYGRLSECLDDFFSKTGIEAHSVEPGTPFDPDTMEPQGTVENPDLNNEDVAAVLRRGFSLHGQPVRPILVDVVRNP